MSATEAAPATIVEVLRRRARSQPGQTAFTYLREGSADEFRMTYAELDGHIRAAAAELRRQAAVGDRALLLYPPGPEFLIGFFACLYAGVVAVPAYPPRLNHNLLRL